MGSQFLDTDSFSTTNEYMSFRETFEKVFPFYLSIGMSYDDFYNNDVTLVIPYREAEKLRQKRKNEELHLQGMYIHEAVQVVIYNTWCRSKNESPITYSRKPYPLFEEDREQDMKEHVEEEQAKAKVWMQQIVDRFSKKFKDEPRAM